MSTERSDKVYASWRESSEKFDYFILGVISALCAFIGQGYKAGKLGFNHSTLELIALLLLVGAAIAGFKRIEKSLLVTLINQRQLNAYEARGGLVAKIPEGRELINEATGHVYTPQDARRRVEQLTKTINELESKLEPTKQSTKLLYQVRNGLTIAGFLSLLAARVWAAYA
jgi:hypothetical protein